MAVGIIFAGLLSKNTDITLSLAFTLSLGIAIQNFPEGAIISMPLKSKGYSKNKSFIYGVLSGIVEPIAAGVTLFLTSIVANILPFLLSFAAGSMVYVTINELIPNSQKGNDNYGTLGFTIGFIIMMVLDVIMG